jgi:hypothetical protein
MLAGFSRFGLARHMEEMGIQTFADHPTTDESNIALDG